MRYTYDGPVLEFGRVIADRWSSSTVAPSLNRARCNLAYQFKKQFNKIASAKITLPGEIKQANEKER